MRISTWEKHPYILFDEARCHVKTFEIKRSHESKDVVDPHMRLWCLLRGALLHQFIAHGLVWPRFKCTSIKLY